MNWSYESNKTIIISYTENGETVTISNKDVLPDTFSFTERICSLDQLDLGTSEANEFSITIFNNFGRLKGKEIKVYLCNAITDTDKYLLGTFKVASDKAVENRTLREIVAYDSMYDLSTMDVSEWYNGIWSDGTTKLPISTFISSLSTRIGKTIEQPQLNGTAYVYKYHETMASLTATEVLRSIGELCGGSYHMTRNGNGLEFVCIAPGNAKRISSSEIMSVDYEEYTVSAITKIVLKANDEDNGYVLGTGSNVYRVVGNILLSEEGITESGAIYASALQSRLSQISYVPFEAKIIASGDVVPGKQVILSLSDGSEVTSYVFENALSGLGGMTSSICSYGDESREDLLSVQSSILNLGRKTSEIANDVNELSIGLSEVSSDYVKGTQYRQDSESMNLKVTSIEREVSQISSELDGDVKQYTVEEAPTFRRKTDDTLEIANYPAVEWTYNIYVHPTEATLIDQDIPFLYTDEYLKKHTRELATNGTTFESYRFILDSGVFSWKQIADSDFGIAMSRIAELTVKSTAIENNVKEVTKTVDSQGTRITKAEGTLVTQANAITAKVSKAEGDSTTSCSWNLTTEAFSVSSNGEEVLRVDGNGLNVKGNGSFSGDITAASLTIGGASSTAANAISGAYAETKDIRDHVYYPNTVEIDGGNIHANSITISKLTESAQSAIASVDASVKQITYYYLATDQSTGVTRSTEGWSTNPATQLVTAEKKYLWTYQKITKLGGATDYTDPALSGVYGDKGNTGNGINQIEYKYARTATPSAPDFDSSIWQDTMPLLDSTFKYLWQREWIDYTDATVTDKKTVVLLASRGGDGSSVKITETSISYAIGDDGENPPTEGWEEEVPEVPLGKYLWTMTLVLYETTTPGSPVINYDTTISYSVSYMGMNGDRGVGISSAIPIYYASNYTSFPADKKPSGTAITSTSTAPNGWRVVIPDQVYQGTKYEYVWTCVQVIDTDGNPSWSDVTLDRGLSNMAKWCAIEDQTVIDGGNIYTGSIDCDKLKADTTIVNHITADNLDIKGGAVNISSETTRANASYLKIENRCKDDDNDNGYDGLVMNPRQMQMYRKHSDGSVDKLIDVDEINGIYLGHGGAGLSIVDGEAEMDGSLFVNGSLVVNESDVLTEDDIAWNGYDLFADGAQYTILTRDKVLSKNTLVLRGKATSSGAYQTVIIPIFTIQTTSEAYGIFEGTSNARVYVKRNSDWDITIYKISSSSGGSFDKAFLQ